MPQMEGTAHGKGRRPGQASLPQKMKVVQTQNFWGKMAGSGEEGDFPPNPNVTYYGNTILKWLFITTTTQVLSKAFFAL